MSAATEVLGDYQHIVSSLALVTGSGGAFEVEVDDQVLYSKKETGRHAEPGEVLQLFTDRYGEGVTKYADS